MSTHAEFHDLVQARLRECFGQPINTLGRADHWAIAPDAFKPEALKPGEVKPAIHVLLNGTEDYPAVWVFDPYRKHDGVYYAALENQAHLDQIIQHIRTRLATTSTP